jgi:hypothetical protein
MLQPKCQWDQNACEKHFLTESVFIAKGFPQTRARIIEGIQQPLDTGLTFRTSADQYSVN